MAESPDANPFESPQAPVAGRMMAALSAEEARERRGRKFAVIVLACFMVPLAAVLGFCCTCTATGFALFDLHAGDRFLIIACVVGGVFGLAAVVGTILWFQRWLRQIDHEYRDPPLEVSNDEQEAEPNTA